MVIIKANSFLYPGLKGEWEDFYDGKVKRPCDEDCEEGCDGSHNYDMPDFSDLVLTTQF